MKKKQDPTRKIKRLHSELMDVYFGNIKIVRCVKCDKKINIDKILEHRKQFSKVFKKHELDLQYPILLISGAFITSVPYVLCRKCQYDTYRFLGKIPDIHDEDTFPQIYSRVVNVDDFMSQLKGEIKTKWQIHYKKKTYPNSKKIYDSLLRKAISAYLKKYPDTPHSKGTLFKTIKSVKCPHEAEIL